MRAQEMIVEALELLNDPNQDFWSDAKMLTHLNRALRDVSGRARSIREVIYQRTAAGQSVYGLPEGFLGDDKFAWLDAGEWYPLLKRRLPQVESLNNSDVASAWRPFFYDVWGRVREERIVAPVSAISADGGLFADNGFPSDSETFGFTFTDGLSGIDTIRVGDIVVNMTDGSEGEISARLSIQPGQVLFAAPRLDNGKRTGAEYGLCLVGDLVRVLTPNVRGHALRIAPAPLETAGAGEEVLWMYLSRRHREITQVAIDNFNDELELDIELETPCFERLLYWCRREELGVKDPETIAQRTVYEDEYRKASPKVRHRNREHVSTWGSPSVAAYRASIELEGVSDGYALNSVNIR